MTNINDFYASTSEFMKKEDVPVTGAQFVVSHLTVEDMKGDHGDEKKPVLHFACGRKMVLNKTNGSRVALALGTEEVEAWQGQTITLYNDPSVEFGGKLVGGIRVAIPQPSVPTPPADPNHPVNAGSGGVSQGQAGGPLNDEVPF